MNLKERIELTRQTLDALERVEANGDNIPDGFVLEVKSTGRDDFGKSDYDVEWFNDPQWFRLRSTAPRQVKLGPEDIPPLSVVRDKDWDSWQWCYVVPESDCVKVSATRTVGYTALMNGWEIKRPGEDWQPCSKDASN